MKHRAPGAWITLNTSYHIGPLCEPDKLLDDASLLLDGAQGITQSLSDLLDKGADVDPDQLAKALWSASTLIQMGQRCVQEAHSRMDKMRKAFRHVETAH